jgi:hypothetical protein
VITYDNGDVEDHARDVTWLGHPEGYNQLAQGGAEGVCETG